ncbi:Retrovirus-related Pol polyprotein from transposon 17.6 [Vitis vinifera]|uniref:RNA-directed DNA polymerase n=1 Tax=Vitis vinifera TaxID=29760 RepID=A0A438H4S5_VITVI|nr:Retrovirus-related Pol polyprotein from transposon 17.6 [Vitis vinifera]
MTRRLEELELKRIHEVQAVAEAPVQVKLCPNCQSFEHLVEECPAISAEREMYRDQANVVGQFRPNNNAPYGNTYNSSWRNHPNFSWKARATQYQQPDPPSQQSSSIEQIIANLSKFDNIQYSISRLTNLNTLQEKEDFLLNLTKIPKVSMKWKAMRENHHREGASEGRNAEEINFSTFSSSITWEKGVRNAAEILEVLRQVKVNIPLLDMIKQVPTYAKFLKDLCTIKRGLTVNKKAFLTEQVSAILQCKSPLKYKDPGSPTISVMIGGKVVEKALLDLGASVNLLPYSVYKQLGLGELKPTAITLSLADRSVKIPRGEANLVPIILGRPFLATSNAIINCRNGLMQLTFGNMTLDLNIFYMSKKQITPEEEEGPEELCIIDTLVEEHCNQHMQDKLNESLEDIEEGFSESPIGLATLQSWRKIEGILPLFNEEEEAAVEKEIPKLNLKPLPVELKYTYLENNQCPVVISSSLTSHQENCLMEVLKRCKKAIGWQISDLKGISPLVCTHHIYMEEEAKPIRQFQRRLNPHLQEVVRAEVLKLLQAGIIYPISDSPWVSPTQVVPKKSGITVVQNEKGEEITTRLTSGWRVCIDYRKLNAVTRKDHFPLPFIDQVLERVSGHPFYCFLDGYSGYFQIEIDLADQEKTTFTCPFGTYAYRRMPFGLCNAPATFQRCMLSIFSDMVERIMEVFMDDITVYGGIVLGHIISEKGIEVDKAKVELIAKLPSPTTVKGVRQFLGHAGFYRRFIKGFSSLSKPLCELLAKDAKFIWDERSCAWPKRRWEALYVIYYASKTLNEAQRNYTTTEKELLAVQDAKARLIRWILLLQEFDLQIKDKKGVENVVADHLSRLVIAHNSHPLPINDDFPEESLMFLVKTPWYAHIANYLVTGEIPNQIIRKCVPEDEQQGILSHCHENACGGHFASQKTAMKIWGAQAIISDGGAHFCNKPFEALLSKYGVKHKVATPYHPQTSGQVELANREIKNILMKVVNSNRKGLHAISLWKLNTKLVGNKEAEYGLDQGGEKRFLDLNEMEELRNNAYINSKVAKQRMKKWHDQLISNKEFQEGQKVLMYDTRLHIFPGKLKSRWIAAKVGFGTRVPLRSTVASFGSCEVTAKWKSMISHQKSHSAGNFAIAKVVWHTSATSQHSDINFAAAKRTAKLLRKWQIAAKLAFCCET